MNNKILYNENWNEWVDMKKFGPASRWLRYLITKNLNLLNYKVTSVLDIGCGEGSTTEMIARNLPYANIIGTDFSETAIKLANKNYRRENLLFIHSNNLESLKNNFDLITSFEVFEHVNDWKNMLNIISNKANKYILLSFPTGQMRKFEVNIGHVRNFKKGEVEFFLYSKKFRPISIFYAGFPFYNPIYRDLCNITNSANNKFTRGKYGFLQKAACSMFYFLFRYFSTKRVLGNQFCGLFEKIIND